MIDIPEPQGLGVRAVSGAWLNSLMQAIRERTPIASAGLASREHPRGLILRVNADVATLTVIAPEPDPAPPPTFDDSSALAGSGSAGSPSGASPSGASPSDESSSGSTSPSDPSPSPSASGSPSSSSSSWSSSSSSYSKSAIVRVKAGGRWRWVELSCVERPDGRFRDTISIPLDADGRGAVRIDPLFRQVCEPGTIRIVSKLAVRVPAAVAVRIDARGRIVAGVTSRPLPPAVIVRIDGIRRGDAGRFLDRSAAEARSNRRFYRRAK